MRSFIESVWSFLRPLGPELQYLPRAIGGFWPSVFLLALAILLPTLLGRFMLGPISRAAGRLRAPTRFQLSDILWLLVHFQIALWYCVRYVGVQQLGFFSITLLTLSLAVLATWAGAVSFVSRAGVIQGKRRVTFILFHLPATLIFMISASFGIIICYLQWTGWVSVELEHQLKYLVTVIGLTTWQVVALFVAGPFIAWGLRRSALWISNDDARLMGTEAQLGQSDQKEPTPTGRFGNDIQIDVPDDAPKVGESRTLLQRVAARRSLGIRP